ncbi:hypothetical protein [Brevibacterium yomogidense]|uniref:ThuA-like domain-containing protein n=1 Tax=Brevibacterium yomogidense TaxID=946573 RepID=A0A1X6X2F4_9MICO|nr:hypothetical protein [Brevibacterium yomogidense]SLM92731.1 conserved hypothetical protein [Brevibacterium yomogidense]
MTRVAFVHTGSFFHLADLRDPAIRAMDITDVYAPDLEPGGLDGFDAVYVAARLHPGVLSRIAPILVEFLSTDGARMYVDGENSVGEWLPGTEETLRGTNFWAWRIGEDVGRRSVNQDHFFWQFLRDDAVHWHYHGVLSHPDSAVPLVRLEESTDPVVIDGPDDPWGTPYRAIPGHANTLMYYDAGTFPAEVVVSTMDASYHHGAGFMPGASQLVYRMLYWLRGATE